MSSTIPSKQKWWHRATIYEVYPSSFKDSNSDGVGDIQGIISKVPYLASLGIDAIWLAACNLSGGVDNGYDVIDYRRIDPNYGTVEDIECLIAELAKHGIRLIMDLVVNHTSSKHTWFLEGRSSKINPKRDWYIWRPSRTDTSGAKILDGRGEELPPNNWKGCVEQRAWTYDELTQEWYMHLFDKEQPDLNWDNPEVRQAVYEEMRFWLQKGIGGFRMDVINLISKAEELPMAGESRHEEKQRAFHLFCNGPKVHDYLQEMRRETVDKYPRLEAVIVGEVICTEKPEDVQRYSDPSMNELSMCYTFDLFGIDHGPGGKFTHKEWNACDFKKRIVKWQEAMVYSKGHWQAVWFESHDCARSVSRFGDGTDANRWKVAKMLALLQSTLGGTIFVYQGQEIGMQNLDPAIPVENYQDNETHLLMKARKEAGTREEDTLGEVHAKARDHARAPLPWCATSSTEPHAGFSSGTSDQHSWSPMNTDSSICNIDAQEEDPASVLNFWRRRIRIRKTRAATLVFGDFIAVKNTMEDGPVLAYWRVPVEDTSDTGGCAPVLVVLNLTAKEALYQLPSHVTESKQIFSILEDTCGTDLGLSIAAGKTMRLSAYRGMVLT